MDNPLLVFLAAIGALTLVNIIHDVLLEARIEKHKQEEAKKIKEKYFT